MGPLSLLMELRTMQVQMRFITFYARYSLLRGSDNDSNHTSALFRDWNFSEFPECGNFVIRVFAAYQRAYNVLPSAKVTSNISDCCAILMSTNWERNAFTVSIDNFIFRTFKRHNVVAWREHNILLTNSPNLILHVCKFQFICSKFRLKPVFLWTILWPLATV